MQPRRRPILWRGCRFCLVVFDSDTIPPFLRTERKTYPHTPVSRKGPDFAIGGEVMRMARVLHRSPSPVPTKWGQGSDPGGMPWKQGRFCRHICGVLMRCRWAFVHFFLHLFAGKPVRSARLVCAYLSTSRKPCEVYPCIFYTTCREVNNHHQGKRVASWRRYFLADRLPLFRRGPRLRYGFAVCCALGSL